MVSILSDFISIKTLKNLSTLMTGTIISVLIPVLTAPISSRIFNSTDYGVLGLYMAVSGLISVVAYAHYQHGILLEKDSDGARQMIWFTMFFCLVVSVFSAIVVLTIYLSTNIIQESEVGLWFLFLPVSIICSGITSCLLIWANRIQQYKSLAVNRIIQSALTVIIQIALGLLIKNETGLLVGFIGGQIISALLLLQKFYVKNENGIGFPRLSTFKEFAYKYKGLLFFSAPSEFINTLINQSPVFLLQRFAGISYVGNYNFSQRLLGMPQTLLSSAIVEVFRQKAALEYHNNGDCRPIFMKTLKALSAISLVPFLILFLFAPSLFAFIFGEQWREAGVISQMLGILYLFRFIISPLTYVYTISGNFKEDFVMHILLLMATLGSFYVGSLFVHDDKYLLLIYSIAYASFYLIYLYRSYQLSKKHNG